MCSCVYMPNIHTHSQCSANCTSNTQFVAPASLSHVSPIPGIFILPCFFSLQPLEGFLHQDLTPPEDSKLLRKSNCLFLSYEGKRLFLLIKEFNA